MKEYQSMALCCKKKPIFLHRDLMFGISRHVGYYNKFKVRLNKVAGKLDGESSVNHDKVINWFVPV